MFHKTIQSQHPDGSCELWKLYKGGDHFRQYFATSEAEIQATVSQITRRGGAVSFGLLLTKILTTRQSLYSNHQIQLLNVFRIVFLVGFCVRTMPTCPKTRPLPTSSLTLPYTVSLHFEVLSSPGSTLGAVGRYRSFCICFRRHVSPNRLECSPTANRRQSPSKIGKIWMLSTRRMDRPHAFLMWPITVTDLGIEKFSSPSRPACRSSSLVRAILSVG
jgi:hypothetical protein